MEKTETAHVLSMMSSCYPSAKITKETAATYHRLLADLTYQDVAKAVDVLMRVESFMPSPAKIRKQVMADAGLLSVDASRAWAMVTAKVAEHGRTRLPEFADGLVAEAVKQVGWRTICDAENEGVLRAQFTRTYASLADSHDKRMLLGSGQPALGSGLNEARKAVTADTAEQVREADEAFANQEKVGFQP